VPEYKFKNITINFKVFGKGFPLVLSHGFTTGWKAWEPQIEDLSRKYQLIVYDSRGHGLSSAPAGRKNYTLDIMAEDLHRLLTYLGIKKAYIGGLSLGGATALGYAHKHPDMVKALLLCDIDGGLQPPDPAAEKKMARIQQEDRRVARDLGLVDLARHKITNGTARRPILESEDRQKEYLERMGRFSLNGYLGVSEELPWKAKWLPKAADSVKVPTLIIAGGDDMLIVDGARILHGHIRGSRYVEIKGCVHGTAEWRPDAFNPAVLKFLEDVETGKPAAEEVYLD
jgi:pimeloyl-ACP methyl ester carboxylesterase